MFLFRVSLSFRAIGIIYEMDTRRHDVKEASGIFLVGRTEVRRKRMRRFRCP
jgi:hypothetical protein